MVSNRDNLFQQARDEVGSFTFDENVADVFADMISRSVPSYQQILKLIPSISRHFYKSDANFYDLGCSIGAGVVAVCSALQNKKCHVIGVDNSRPMCQMAQQNVDALGLAENPRVTIVEDDIRSYPLEKSALTLVNFTLQFLPLEHRQALLEEIFAATRSGGALLLSEKIRYEKDSDQALATQLHHQYKADQGYSELEISQKRQALEDVLITETKQSHTDRLHQVGFDQVFLCMQSFQFVSLLAVRH